MLTEAMKREIVSYMLEGWSKGLIEDSQSNPEVAGAFVKGEVSSGEIEEYVEACKLALLERLP